MDTSDLAQSAMVDALKALPSYRDRGPGSFRSWLLGILKNKWRRRISYFTAERRDGRREVQLSSSGVIPDSAPTALAAALGEEERRRLRQSIDSLPGRYGQVLELRYWRELPWTDVGRDLGITEEAAQMLCRRALLKLREQFDSRGSSGSR
jgi:RNA polymerase sigma-70 factor (ECF subfamily)